MRWAAGAFVALSACYSPTVPAGAPCDMALNNCPAGQRCELTASGAFCGAVPAEPDGGIQAADGAPRDSAPGCYGTGLVHDICLMPAPTTDVALTADRTVNTAMVGSPNCDAIIAQPGGGATLCMIAARSIVIDTGVKLTGIGPNPLLLVATESITVDGTIDVASRLGMMATGAGASTTCASEDGRDATVDLGAGGGGAGGSFGSAGASGGTGLTPGSPTPGGSAASPQTPTTLRGGCAGGAGGEARGGGGNGAGGAGGGAVYLIAGGSIAITGTINASGSGGGAGTAGAQASGGAGGGGSGGMIGLDAPSITSSGEIFANGGSGGGGGGNRFDRPGKPGATPITASNAAPGGSGGDGGGGDGGNGYVGTSAPTKGENGTNAYCSGGGGGGGAGVIRVYGASPGSLGGSISPPPT